MDIDNFKNINDRYGHDMGDKVLVQLSRMCRKLLRANDVFGRMGGEEFTILLPESTIEEAREIAIRLRKMLSQTQIEADGCRVSFTASFGVAQFDTEDKSCECALKRADVALYKAKSEGRNCVVADAAR